jgi:hypothetical protein
MLLLSGDTDLKIPSFGTRNWIDTLELKEVIPFKPFLYM